MAFEKNVACAIQQPKEEELKIHPRTPAPSLGRTNICMLTALQALLDMHRFLPTQPDEEGTTIKLFQWVRKLRPRDYHRLLGSCSHQMVESGFLTDQTLCMQCANHHGILPPTGAIHHPSHALSSLLTLLSTTRSLEGRSYYSICSDKPRGQA